MPFITLLKKKVRYSIGYARLSLSIVAIAVCVVVGQSVSGKSKLVAIHKNITTKKKKIIIIIVTRPLSRYEVRTIAYSIVTYKQCNDRRTND